MDKELKKIVTIGPVYPYRGGISQYGSLLIKELEKSYEVKSMSFSLMYPSILYPGKSQKDYSTVFDINSEVSYIINTVNPVSYVKTANAINLCRILSLCIGGIRILYSQISGFYRCWIKV